MRLDRNENLNGRGKYALLKLRDLEQMRMNTPPYGELDGPVVGALEKLEAAGVLDWGRPETEAEFFVIRLRDKYAAAALAAYATVAQADDPEYAAEIMEMVKRSGPLSPFVKRPD